MSPRSANWTGVCTRRQLIPERGVAVLVGDVQVALFRLSGTAEDSPVTDFVYAVGHKDPAAPAPPESPDWYRRLERPAGAEDVFHIKRLNADESEELFARVGLTVLEREDLPVDEYRSNHFFRLARAQ